MKQILCFGDSNTWGLIPKTKQRYPWGVRWTSILDNELNRHFNPSLIIYCIIILCFLPFFLQIQDILPALQLL
jgi:hypothetical protein